MLARPASEAANWPKAVRVDVLAQFLGISIGELVSPDPKDDLLPLSNVGDASDIIPLPFWPMLLRDRGVPEDEILSLEQDHNPGLRMKQKPVGKTDSQYKIKNHGNFFLECPGGPDVFPDSPLNPVSLDTRSQWQRRKEAIFRLERSVASKSRKSFDKWCTKIKRRRLVLQKTVARLQKKLGEKVEETPEAMELRSLVGAEPSKFLNFRMLPLQVKRDQELLKLWKAAPNFSARQIERILNGLSDHQEWIALARQNKASLKQAGLEASNSFSVLLHLWEDFIRSDDPKLELLVPEFLLQATKSLNSLADSDPDRFRRLTEQLISWPILSSKHPKFWKRDRELLKHLGNKTKRSFGPVQWQSDWDPFDPATRVVLELLSSVHAKREKILRLQKVLGAGIDEIKPEIPRKIAMLPPFGRDEAAIQWWEVARALILENIPDPSSDPMLRALSYSKNSKKPRSRGRINADIMKNLRGRFISMAGRHKAFPD